MPHIIDEPLQTEEQLIVLKEKCTERSIDSPEVLIQCHITYQEEERLFHYVPGWKKEATLQEKAG